MNFTRSFDSLYSDLLTAHFNKSGKNAGIMIRIIYSAVAVVAWGICQLGLFILRQIIPSGDTDGDWIRKHAKHRGLEVIAGESDADLLQRYYDDINYPVSGGNKKDWERWVRDFSHTHYPGQGAAEWVEQATHIKVTDGNDARGPGSINIAVITNNTDLFQEGVATDAYIAALTTYLAEPRPLGIWDFQVFKVEQLPTDLIVEIEADDFNAVRTLFLQRVSVLILSLLPGQKLTISSLISLAEECGASDVRITAPAANVQPENGPTSYERCYPGTISVSEIV